jgi:hypothetical protein
LIFNDYHFALHTSRLFTMFVLGLVLAFFVACNARPSESDRIKLWKQNKKNTWPPTWQQETEKFKEAMEFREKELLMLPGLNERWENYMQFTQSRLVPRFTTHGFEVIQTPESIHQNLKAAVDKGIDNWEHLRHERQIDAVHTPLPSKFVDLHGMDWEVLSELKELHEQWGGMALEPTSAYGVRLYQNGSSLIMHYDKVSFHSLDTSQFVHNDCRSTPTSSPRSCTSPTSTITTTSPGRSKSRTTTALCTP